LQALQGIVRHCKAFARHYKALQGIERHCKELPDIKSNCNSLQGIARYSKALQCLAIH